MVGWNELDFFAVEVEMPGLKLAAFSFYNLFLGNREQEDGRQDNNRADPKSGGHFIHIAKKNKGHDDTIYRLEVGDERHPEGRKLTHNRYPGHIGQRCTDCPEQ